MITPLFTPEGLFFFVIILITLALAADSCMIIKMTTEGRLGWHSSGSSASPPFSFTFSFLPHLFSFCPLLSAHRDFASYIYIPPSSSPSLSLLFISSSFSLPFRRLRGGHRCSSPRTFHKVAGTREGDAPSQQGVPSEHSSLSCRSLRSRAITTRGHKGVSVD